MYLILVAHYLVVYAMTTIMQLIDALLLIRTWITVFIFMRELSENNNFNNKYNGNPNGNMIEHLLTVQIISNLSDGLIFKANVLL